MNKKYILKSKKEFDLIINKGKRINSKYFLIFYMKSFDFKLGISVPKKLGNAVFRNYNKRVIKNIIPKLDIYDINLDMVLIVNKNFINLSFEEKQNVLKEAFQGLKINE